VSRIDYPKMSDEDILKLGSGGAPGDHDDRPVDHWVTINHQHILITSAQDRSQGECPPEKKAFFGTLGGIFKRMGQAANTNPGFIAALSAYESSWLARHAQVRPNPFGLTAGGHNDLSFPSYEIAASYWLYHAGRDRNGYAHVVSSINTIGAFVAALRAIMLLTRGGHPV